MADPLIANALSARQAATRLERVAVVVGDSLDVQLWTTILEENHQDRIPRFWVEQGRKGNLLGTLQAYAGLSPGAGQPSPVDQIVMFFGSGTRLSPFTQALRNVKAAFPLPDGERGASGITIGEAAIRSGSPWIDLFRDAGFSGVLVTWGDEVLIPSTPFAAHRGPVSNADVVRFGWATEPTVALATQKEWFVADARTNVVLRDLPRQPLPALVHSLRDVSGSDPIRTFVNLGSFAATHDFLSVACEAFGERLFDDGSSANWDPYFWRALQCSSADEWASLLETERAAGLSGCQSLIESVPDFFQIILELRENFERRAGRPPRVVVADFGEPYWIDIGNHAALGSALSSIFVPGRAGEVIRAFLGLPESLSSGGSFVVDSTVPLGCVVENSIVVGSQIGSLESSIRGSVVLGARIGLLSAASGAAVISCRLSELRIEGPNAVAFRLKAEREVICPNASATTIYDGEEWMVLRYEASLGPIDRGFFEKSVLSNPVSYAEAAKRVAAVDPSELHRWWSVGA